MSDLFRLSHVRNAPDIDRRRALFQEVLQICVGLVRLVLQEHEPRDVCEPPLGSTSPPKILIPCAHRRTNILHPVLGLGNQRRAPAVQVRDLEPVQHGRAGRPADLGEAEVRHAEAVDHLAQPASRVHQRGVECCARQTPSPLPGQMLGHAEREIIGQPALGVALLDRDERMRERRRGRPGHGYAAMPQSQPISEFHALRTH